ncbi:MAG: DCC1-like thiol-disulfide oxidoreductase family protein [Roseobacter sp.]
MRKFKAIWLFDGDCVLCNKGVQYTLRYEKSASIQFIAIQSDEGRRLALEYQVDPDNPETFLFLEHGTAFTKSDAVLALSKHLTGPARIASVLLFVPKPLRDAIYGMLARNRYAMFGKTVTCMVPDKDQRDRFVL